MMGHQGHPEWFNESRSFLSWPGGASRPRPPTFGPRLQPGGRCFHFTPTKSVALSAAATLALYQPHTAFEGSSPESGLLGGPRKQMKSQSPLRKTGFPRRFAKLGSALPALLYSATGCAVLSCAYYM